MFKKILKYCICLVVCVSAVLVGMHYYSNINFAYRTANSGIIKTDSIYTNRPYKLKEIEHIQQPIKVVVYQVDTLIRDQVENDTIITGLTITEDQLSVEKITPKGIIYIDTYDLNFNEIKKIDINNKGQVQLKQKKPFIKFLNKQCRWMVPVGLLIVGAVIGGVVSK